MTVEIRLFGFGDERPARFQGENRLHLEITTPTSPSTVLRAAGIDQAEGLVLMNTDTVIPAGQWDDAIIQDKDVLTVLCAFEGG